MRVVHSLALLLVASSCRGTSGDDLRSQSSAIVGGEPSPSAATPVVAIGGAGRCTGTLVAPNLVLTAKHCVADVLGAIHECNELGQLVVDPDAGVVDVTPDAGWFGSVTAPDKLTVGPYGGTAFAPRVSRVLASPAATVCETDVAFLVLDRPMDDPTIAPIRLDRAPAIGERLVATGWGVVSDKDYATTLQQRDVTVVAVGPQPEQNVGGVSFDALPPNFFTVGEALCHGDSGGPALAASGAVVGVASAITRSSPVLPSGTATDCTGTDVRGKYEATSAEKEFIVSAFAEANAKPWLEGDPDPRANLLPFGARCARDEDCASNVCVGRGEDLRCSKGCLDDRCPDAYRCEAAADRKRCLPLDTPQADAAPSSSGCSSANTTASAPLVILGALALVVSMRRRRRRN